MRIVSLLSWAAIVLGAVGIVAGKTFDVPKGVHLGVFLIGAGFALGGLESLFTRRMSLRFSGDAGEAYEGAPAVIWGLMALVIGALFMAAAYVVQSGTWRSTLDQLARHPGPAFVTLGLLVAGSGALLMARADGARGIWHRLFVRYPRMLIGLAIAATGLLAAGMGAWEWASPRSFDHYVRSPEGVYVRTVSETWKGLLRGDVRVPARRPRAV